MKPPGSEMPQVVVKWYAYAKWVLERVESFPKSQRFILGQRLSNHVMDVLETLVKASYAKDKTVLLIQANEGIEMTRWVVRMASDRKLLAPKQFGEFRGTDLFIALTRQSGPNRFKIQGPHLDYPAVQKI